MQDELDDSDSLLDEDPALDFILYQELEKEGGKKGNSGGCFSVVFLGAFSMTPLLYIIARKFS